MSHHIIRCRITSFIIRRFWRKFNVLVVLALARPTSWIIGRIHLSGRGNRSDGIGWRRKELKTRPCRQSSSFQSRVVEPGETVERASVSSSSSSSRNPNNPRWDTDWVHGRWKKAHGEEKKAGRGRGAGTGWESAVPGEVERKLRGGRRKLESFWNGGW